MDSRGYLFASMIAVAAPSAALAQDEGSAASNAPEEIIVIGIRSDALDRKSEAGSRLGLSLRETPQTIDTLSSATILGRGLHTLEDATRALPGVLAGFPPGDMGNFSVRGFTGNQVSLLFNGFYYGPANFIARPGSSFTIDRIEAVKGPASILYGNGAVGGAINVVTKEAVAGRNEIMALGSYGSFDTYDLGLDVAHQFDTLALRAIVSQNGSNGYVHDSHSHAFNAHVSALWQAAPSFEVAMSIDYLRDRPSGYYGTPLVPEAVARDPLNVLERGNGLSVDGAMRKINYNNLTDATIRSRQWMPQAKLRWTPAENIQVQNEIYYIDAHRVWKNSEVYNYNSVTGLIDRDRFAIDQYEQLWGDRATARFKHKLGRMQNTFLVGFEYSHLDFKQYRGFPNGDSVNPWNPAPANFGPIKYKLSPTKWDNYAVFAEDTLAFTPKLRAVLGFRFDHLDLNRKNYNFDGSFGATTSFKRGLDAPSYRAALVFNPSRDISTYLSFSTGRDLAGTSSSLFLINAAQGKTFKLASTQQFEAGLKASLPDGRADFTASIYHIKRKNMLTQLNTQGDLSNIGSIRSRGIDLAGTFHVTRNWSLSADLSYTDARYGTFVDPANAIDASGNRPPNVAKWVGGVWTSWKQIGGIPLEVGGGIRAVSSRYIATNNKVKLRPYQAVDTYITYNLTSKTHLTGRIKNLFDKDYVQWADIFYPSEIMLASPRTFEASLITRF